MRVYQTPRPRPVGCDLDLEPGLVLIRRVKNDQAGDGRIAWLSPDIVLLVCKWLEVSQVT